MFAIRFGMICTSVFRNALIAAFCVLFLGAEAQAHSKLLSTEPADGAVSVASPSEITMAFNKPLRLVQMSVTGPSGDMQILDLGDQIAVLSESFSIAVPELSEGDWSVSWSALGGDGHAMRGSFTFHIQP